MGHEQHCSACENKYIKAFVNLECKVRESVELELNLSFNQILVEFYNSITHVLVVVTSLLCNLPYLYHMVSLCAALMFYRERSQ